MFRSKNAQASFKNPTPNFSPASQPSSNERVRFAAPLATATLLFPLLSLLPPYLLPPAMAMMTTPEARFAFPLLVIPEHQGPPAEPLLLHCELSPPTTPNPPLSQKELEERRRGGNQFFSLSFSRRLRQELAAESTATTLILPAAATNTRLKLDLISAEQRRLGQRWIFRVAHPIAPQAQAPENDWNEPAEKPSDEDADNELLFDCELSLEDQGLASPSSTSSSSSSSSGPTTPNQFTSHPSVRQRSLFASPLTP